MIRFSRVPVVLLATMVAGATAAFAATPHAIDSPYLLDTCPVTGGALGSMGDPVVKAYEGREVKFCCQGCIAKFEADQASFLSKIDAKIAAEQGKDYPLDTCPVTGQKLGSMGDPVDHVHGNRLVRLCCAGCENKVAQDPQQVLAPLNKAVVDAQKAQYPLETCVVTGQKLGSMGDPVDVVVGNTLVRLCCAGCEGKLAKDAAASLQKLSGKAPGTAPAGHGGAHTTHRPQAGGQSCCPSSGGHGSGGHGSGGHGSGGHGSGGHGGGHMQHAGH
jgi:hypothetical protein